MDAKFSLARTITADFMGPRLRPDAEARFRTVHQRRETPRTSRRSLSPSAEPQLVRLLVSAGLSPSNSEARRLLQQGGVRLDGEPVTDPFVTVAARSGNSYLVQVGKRRFARITFA
jgi:tyrosyl-tRNA synthetase